MDSMEVRNRRQTPTDAKTAMTNNNTTPTTSRYSAKRLCIAIIVVGTLAIALTIICSASISPVELVLPPLPEASGVLAINSRLSKAKRIAENQVVGAESIAVVKGVLFTGTVNGTIVRIDDKGARIFSRLGATNCTSPQTCGRPLGIRYDENNKRLVVVDAYLGVFAVDINNGAATKLFPLESNTDFKVTFFDDFDFLPDGNLAISEASQRFQLDSLLYDTLEGKPTGRLLIVNLTSSSWITRAQNLYFPNGVQLHQDGRSLLFCETTKARILRIPLYEGNPVVFSTALPGFPDNIRTSPRGGYWVGLFGKRFVDSPSWLDALAPWPSVRYTLHKMFSISTLFKFFTKSKHGMIIRIDERGNIVEALHDTTGNVYNSAEVVEHDNKLYIGSFYAPFVAQLDL